MEIFMVALAIAYMVSGKFSSDTAKAAYKAGKEPPGVVKARMRHQRGGGARSASGKPTGPGATRLLLAQRWTHACEKAKDRADDKHRRWRAWYAEQAPTRHEQWRDKQANRIAKSERRAEKFAAARGLLNPVAARRENQAWDENSRRDSTTNQDALGFTDREGEGQLLVSTGGDSNITGDPADPSTWRGTDRYGRDIQTGHGPTREEAGGLVHDDDTYLLGQDVSPERHIVQEHQEKQQEPAAVPANPQEQERAGSPDKPNAAELASDSAVSIPTQDTGSTGEITVYEQRVAQLHNHADEVEGYSKAVKLLGDEMAGVGWGAEVHGPLTDLQDHLRQASGRYRDLAEVIKHQGDQVNDAYEDAPWAPDKAALVQ